MLGGAGESVRGAKSSYVTWCAMECKECKEQLCDVVYLRVCKECKEQLCEGVRPRVLRVQRATEGLFLKMGW